MNYDRANHYYLNYINYCLKALDKMWKSVFERIKIITGKIKMRRYHETMRILMNSQLHSLIMKVY